MKRLFRSNFVRACFIAFCLTCWLPSAFSFAQTEYTKAPIHYHTAPSSDAIASFADAVNSGSKSIAWDDKTGWLESLLQQLKVPVASQTLVFSKTSLQISRISARKPRAVYFNDNVYIGYVQGGGVIEASAIDDQLGPVFYSIKQTPDAFVLKRDKGECMSCHSTNRTRNVPGYLVRSVYPQADGTPFYGLGTTTTEDSTPLLDRFGGWYVTGAHGKMRHRGNAIADDTQDPPIDFEPGANRGSLNGLVDTQKYITDTSDMVALMVLEHQSQMHNLFTRAHYEFRLATHHDKSMNELLDRKADFVSDSTKRRIARAGNQLVDYLLLKNAIRFTSPVRGNSTFQSDFERVGPRDSSGRSLRQLDLETGLFKYPCSFLIFSRSYASLPAEVREHVETRLASILNGDAAGEFDYITGQQRAVIRGLLSKHLPGFKQRL